MLKKIFLLFKFVWLHALNKNNRLASLWRVISFQITIRIIKAPIILLFVNGAQLTTSCGMIGATGDLYYTLREYDLFKHQLKSLQGKYKLTSNTLYLKKLDEIKRRISRKNTFTLGTGQKI